MFYEAINYADHKALQIIEKNNQMKYIFTTPKLTKMKKNLTIQKCILVLQYIKFEAFNPTTFNMKMQLDGDNTRWP